jgi:hypothetical protein
MFRDYGVYKRLVASETNKFSNNNVDHVYASKASKSAECRQKITKHCVNI